MADLHFEAIIFDLDGVVTDTAKVHAVAWKELFDGYLKSKETSHGEPFTPFDKESDYLSYIDGKPRYEGIKSFLHSRGLSLPYGHPSDDPDQETICGLGNRKNNLFAAILKRDGVEVFQSTVRLIKESRMRGVKTAIVSSSKNCLGVLQIAGIETLFDARVDGALLASLGLRGKPNPDIFVKCAEILGVDVGKTVVVEDSIAGVEAGRAGRFGLVLGIARRKNSAALRESGADLVVTDLSEIGLRDIDAWFLKRGDAAPSALNRLEEVQRRLSHHRVVVFLDYDGTLTPIVDRPEQAVMSEEMRAVVRQLAASCTTAIVSGRSRAKVQDLVRVEGLIYAGSHGFDIAGPGGSRIEHEEGRRFSSAIESAYRHLTGRIRDIEGALVEHTGYSLSVHYRLVAADQVATVEEIVDQVLKDHPALRKTLGKKVFELRPNIDWDKGKAVLWILRTLSLEGPEIIPLYLGDDTTDEDAFRAVRGRGIGILVTEEPRATAATYSLRNVPEVKQFLQSLTTLLSQSHP